MKALLLLVPLVALAQPAQAMTDAQEIALGKSLLPLLARWLGPTLPASDPIAQRVQRVGAPFGRLSARRNLTYSYRVIANDEIANAMAAPGGFIYITRRMVNLTANDAELAAVLAHETAHIDRRHASQTFEARERMQKAASQLSARFLGVRDNLAVSLATDLAFVVFSRGYARDKESEADAWGARRMSQLGYDPGALVTVLGRATKKAAPNELETLVDQHPPMLARQMTLRELIRQEKLLEIARRQGGPHFWLPDTR